jgi:hypothetical protein
MEMPCVLAPGVEDEIRRTFAPEDVAYVRSRLTATGLPWGQNAPPSRVHIAVIWLSEGDRQRFDRELAGACADWRDTLMNAGLANADWRDVIQARGVDLRDRDAD